MTNCLVKTRFLPLTGYWAQKFVYIAFPLLVFAIDALNAEDLVPEQIKELDGKSFSGELGLLGKPASATDLLVFDDGMFVSKGCEARCGYTAAEYQVVTEVDRYQVKSETPCLNSDAIIQWQGTVKGDSIEGTFTWINKRWYWSFEKVFWFKGKLVDSTAQ